MDKTNPLLEQKFNTTSAHIKDLLDAFLIHYPKKGTILETLEIIEEKIGNHSVQFLLILNHPGYGSYIWTRTSKRAIQLYSNYYSSDGLYGWIGTVKSEPINEHETWIKVSLTSNPRVFVEKEEEKKTEAWKFLQAFFKHLQNRISDIQPGPIIPTTKKVGAKKPDPDYKIILEKASFEDTTGWDVTLIDMWNEGYSRNDIATRANISPNRVTNRISELRRILGKNGNKVLPYDKDRKKNMIKSRDMT
jgi:hypothetical protein